MEKENLNSNNKFRIKFNWGTGIFVFLMLFLGIFAYFIWFSFQQPLNLVDTNYYPKGLEYERQISKFKNSAKLEKDISISQDSINVFIEFPTLDAKKINGNILFYYPPDSRKDYKLQIELDTANRSIVSKNKLIRGQKYNVLVDWKADSLEYYFEEKLQIE